MATIPLFSQNPGGRPRKVVNPMTVISLRAKGLSWRLIAARLGVSDRTIRRVVQERIATVLPQS
jgi:DNA invertase Pin-like site-specific DNA recombinase